MCSRKTLRMPCFDAASAMPVLHRVYAASQYINVTAMSLLLADRGSGMLTSGLCLRSSNHCDSRAAQI